MSLHLIKLAVGIETVADLAERQKRRLETARENGGAGVLRHLTRSRPRRGDEILDGGSIYWVIRRAVRVRQRILAMETVFDDEKRARCALILDPQLVRVEFRPWRSFQGWRYLDAADAPSDAGEDGTAELPENLAAELRRLGLL